MQRNYEIARPKLSTSAPQPTARLVPYDQTLLACHELHHQLPCRSLEGNQWLFLRSTEENTREFAAVLAVNYKKITPLDFSHSNIISVFNSDGELTYQQEGLGVNSDQTIEKITEEAEKTN